MSIEQKQPENLKAFLIGNPISKTFSAPNASCAPSASNGISAPQYALTPPRFLSSSGSVDGSECRTMSCPRTMEPQSKNH